jgi:serine/threonine protein kinase
MKQKIQKWQRMIKHSVDEIIDVNLRKFVFDRQKEIVLSNPKLHERNVFIEYFFRNYAEAQVLAVSRLVEDKPVDSLVALLNDILVNYEDVIQSGELKSLLVSEMSKTASDDFIKNHFQKQIEDRINSFSWEKVNSDKFDLLKATAKIKLLRDKWVAHRDTKRKQMNIQYNEVNQAIKFIEEKVDEYYLFLTDAKMASFLPVGIEGDDKIFNFVWQIPDIPDPDTSAHSQEIR